jgi:hypothetical protein
MKQQTKICRACRTTIDARASICPACRTKQPNARKAIGVLIIAGFVGMICAFGSNSNSNQSTAAAPAVSQSDGTQSKWVVVMDRPPACRTREQMDKIVEFSVKKDYVAMSRVWDTCGELKGWEVVVEENPLFSDNVCVRVIGEVNCVWTNKAAVKRINGSSRTEKMSSQTEKVNGSSQTENVQCLRPDGTPEPCESRHP